MDVILASLLFRNVSPGILLNSLIIDAGIGLLQCFRPWRANARDNGIYWRGTHYPLAELRRNEKLLF